MMNNLSKSFWKATVLCFLALAVNLQSQLVIAQQLSSAVVKEMDQFLIKYGDDTPGASILVSRNGEIIYEKYAGMADLEHGQKISDQTVFEAGSVSKQFTAAGILLLVNEGKVDLDDEIQRYIPEVPVYERPITVRHLFNHTSGLKDWGSLAGLGGWDRGTRIYTNDIALKYIIRQPDLNYLPGDEYLYSNSNYTLMTILLERVSGQSLAEFTAEHFFKPLGMKQTSWRDNFSRIVPGRAVGYSKSGNNYVMNMPFENTYGHAALLTTVRDLKLWNESWYQLANDQQGAVSGKLAGLRNLREHQGILTNGDTISYASGVMIRDHNGVREVSHSGATAGYRAWLAYYPKEEISIIFLSNDAHAQTTATGEGLADILLGPKEKAAANSNSASNSNDIQISEELIQAMPGVYNSEAVEGKWTVSQENGQLKIQVHPHSRQHTVRATGEDQFFATGLGAIKVVREGNKVNGFYVTIDRARNVWFEKGD